MSEGNGQASENNLGVCSLCGALIHPQLAVRHALMHQAQGWDEGKAAAMEVVQEAVQRRAVERTVAPPQPETQEQADGQTDS